MSTVKRLAIAVALGVSCSAALAGSEFLFNFNGTAYETNGAGEISSTQVSDQTILRDIAAKAGIADPSSLALVYHAQGNAMGDTIDVVNANTGAVLDTFIGLYFGEAFGRMAYVARSGTPEVRYDYIYTDQNDHSLGAAMVIKYYNKDAQGNRALSRARGQMTWLVTPTGTQNSRFITGKFSTGKELPVSASP